MDSFQYGIIHEWEKRVNNKLVKIALKRQLVHNSGTLELEIFSWNMKKLQFVHKSGTPKLVILSLNLKKWQLVSNSGTAEL
jgi:hypothetical protein